MLRKSNVFIVTSFVSGDPIATKASKRIYQKRIRTRRYNNSDRSRIFGIQIHADYCNNMRCCIMPDSGWQKHFSSGQAKYIYAEAVKQPIICANTENFQNLGLHLLRTASAGFSGIIQKALVQQIW